MRFLNIQHVTYSYEGGEDIVKNVSWQINQGEFHCLLGKSGCGKTTLLKVASGLLRPRDGAVYLGEKMVMKPSPHTGFVFQSPTLLEWKTVVENVLLPISLKKKPTRVERKRAESLLEMMKLGQYLHHFPTELSGGQQSRVAIARALINNPDMLFLDEPFAALDAITREELQDDLLTLCRMQKITVLFITHDISEAVYLSDCVAVMKDGRIAFDVQVNLPKPRKVEMRYDQRFNELCLQVRQAMSGGIT